MRCRSSIHPGTSPVGFQCILDDDHAGEHDWGYAYSAHKRGQRIYNLHTPGPWQAVCPSEEAHLFPHVVVGPDIPYPDHSGMLHATITINEGGSVEAHKKGTGFGTTHETACANARLIAAAPELLAALQRLLDMPREQDMETHIHITCMPSDIEQARAAIAKATQP